MSKVWTFQKDAQVKKLGVKAPWLVGWYDPQGRRNLVSVRQKVDQKTQAPVLQGLATSCGIVHERTVPPRGVEPLSSD